jgi:NitT/TauT family transport system ATP-binding protein
MPWATAERNIAYALKRAGAPSAVRSARVAEVAGEVSLEPDDLIKYPSELSGGMKQRVAIARALSIRPDFVFFDEPFTALDVALKRRMQDLVIAASVAGGMAGLFITHDLIEAARVADRIAVMHPTGMGIAGVRDVPGERGARIDSELFAWVQRSLSHDDLFRHIHDVDERRLA